MTSIGETLRRERLRRHLDLDQVARETKISAKLLDAIEAERFDKLPGGVFTKSFVRQYARLLGLDEDEIVGELEHALRPSQLMEPPAEPAPFQRGDFTPPVTWNPGARIANSRSALPAFALVVVVILMCSAIYAWWQRSRTQVRTAVPPVSAAVSSTPPRAVEKERAVAPAPPAPAPRPAAAQTPLARLQIVLTAQQQVWVSAEVDGKPGYRGTLEQGQTQTIQGEGRMKLVVGNAGALDVTLNGKPVGALGKTGEVVTLEFTPEGFQTVRRKPVVFDDSL